MKATRQDIINYIEAFRSKSFHGSFCNWFTKEKGSAPETVTGKAEYNTPLPPFQPDIRGIRLSGIHLSGLDLTLVNFSGSDLALADFSGADLGGSVFHKADVTGSYFQNASLILASFEKADATIADFSGAKLPGADFSEANLTDADFNKANLRGAKFENANLTGTAFIGAGLEGAVFHNVTFARTDFARAYLGETVFTGKSIIGAVFTGADVEDVRFRLSPVRKVDMDGSSTEEEPVKEPVKKKGKTVSFRDLPSPVLDDNSSVAENDIENFRGGGERNISVNDVSVIETVSMPGSERSASSESVVAIGSPLPENHAWAGGGTWAGRISEERKISSRSSSESLQERQEDGERQSLHMGECLKRRKDNRCCAIL